MIDTQHVKQLIDLRDIVESDLGAPRQRSAKYHAYRCPFHHETKGYSLIVYADGWQCYGKCQISGDAISWMMDFRGLTFQEACNALARGLLVPTDRKPVQQQPRSEVSAAPPSDEWQHYAGRIVSRAQEYLWSDGGSKALDYLRGRGLDDQIIEQAQIGYVPARNADDLTYGRVLAQKWLKPDGKPVRIMPGITIPHFADGNLWAVRIRTDSGIPKYVGIAGGSKALYWADHITPQQPVMIVEGEFDCLIVHQVVSDVVSPVAIASASNSRINRRWLPFLITAPVIMARMDADGAGQKALAGLQELSSRIHPVSVPVGKDVNEYYLACVRYPTPCPRERFLSWIDFHMEVA